MTNDEQKELERLRKKEQERELQEICQRRGHVWIRYPYCGPGGTNYLFCKRCGLHTED